MDVEILQDGSRVDFNDYFAVCDKCVLTVAVAFDDSGEITAECGCDNPRLPEQVDNNKWEYISFERTWTYTRENIARLAPKM